MVWLSDQKGEACAGDPDAVLHPGDWLAEACSLPKSGLQASGHGRVKFFIIFTRSRFARRKQAKVLAGKTLGLGTEMAKRQIFVR